MMKRLLFVFALVMLPASPVMAADATPQQAASPSVETAPEPQATGVVETIKEKATEFFTPPSEEGALAEEPLPEEIADSVHQEFEESHADDEHAAKGGLPQFDPTWFASQVFWLAIAFIVLYAFFAKKTLPALSATIENRKDHIQSDLDQAEELTEKAEGVQASYEAGLQGARDQAAQAVADIHAMAAKRSAEMTEDFRQRADGRTKETEANITKAKEKAMAEMSDIVASVAAEAVQKIIGVSTDVKDARNVVDTLGTKSKKAA